MRMMQTGALALAALAVTGAAACGSSDDRDEQGTTTTTSRSTSPSGASAPSAGASASVSRLAAARRAVRTAERRVSRGRAYDIESDRLRGRRVWEVKVARGTARPYELDVRADGRQVVRQRRKARVSDDVRKVAAAKVSLRRALGIAGRRAQQGRFDEAEIDRSRGRIVWEATFERSRDREVEVTVDARTGRVVRVSTDD